MDISTEQLEAIKEMTPEQVMKAMLAVLVEMNENVKEVRDAVNRGNPDFAFDREFPDKA